MIARKLSHWSEKLDKKPPIEATLLLLAGIGVFAVVQLLYWPVGVLLRLRIAKRGGLSQCPFLFQE